MSESSGEFEADETWLEREVAQRFDLACCVTQDQFIREARAITQARQIKDRGGRHEKDDRSRIDDRSRYVLGWSNLEKIATPEKRRGSLEAEIGDIGMLLSGVQSKLRNLQERLNRWLDWNSFVASRRSSLHPSTLKWLR